MNSLSSRLAKLLMALSTPVLTLRMRRTFARFKAIDPHKSILQDQNTIKDRADFAESSETADYTRQHSLTDGIERIHYLPKNKRYQTPLLFQHGMWHGAWCWRWWQELFAQWGWESYAFSLPGHAASPPQRPIKDCTLDYYTSFLRVEIERLDSLPVLLGHSMGGAIAQWYLKYVRDDLPAVVLVAAWAHSNNFASDSPGMFIQLDPWGVLQSLFAWTATPMIRAPEIAARKLISEGAIITAAELHHQLSPESLIVMIQHSPPYWEPKAKIQAPMLYLAGEIDALLSKRDSQQTAQHYQADFLVIEKAAHNLMMEHNFAETAQKIHDWLLEQGID